MEKFTVISHTADIGITAYGETLPVLFAHAAAGMFSLLDVVAPPSAEHARTVAIKGADDETLLINWLNELLYLVAVEKFHPVSFTVQHAGGGSLQAELRGRAMGPGTTQSREIKSATYHNLKIEHTGHGYSATIIFDV